MSRRIEAIMGRNPVAVRSQAGFSLLELVIALTLFGFIMVGLSGGLRFGMRSWRSQDLRLSHYAEMDAVANTLRTLIAGGRAFSGDSSTLSFTAALPESLGVPGLYDVRLEADEDGIFRLSWKSRRHKPDTDSSQALETAAEKAANGEAELLRNVAMLDIAYFANIGAGHSEWEYEITPEKPPLLIRLRLGLRRGDPRVWNDLVVAPRIDGNKGGGPGAAGAAGTPPAPGAAQPPQPVHQSNGAED
jgi:general secretion pathway protein J